MEEERGIPDPPSWFKWLPIVSITLSVIMLMFQIFVLHGWHMKLSNQMRHVKGKI
jgi:ABC-type multidrug transport system permease subunit